MPPDGGSEQLTLAEAAEWLGITPRTLERWAKAGRIPSTVTAAGERRFRLEDLVASSTRSDDVGRDQP